MSTLHRWIHTYTSAICWNLTEITVLVFLFLFIKKKNPFTCFVSHFILPCRLMEYWFLELAYLHLHTLPLFILDHFLCWYLHFVIHQDPLLWSYLSASSWQMGNRDPAWVRLQIDSWKHVFSRSPVCFSVGKVCSLTTKLQEVVEGGFVSFIWSTLELHPLLMEYAQWTASILQQYV